jgi:nucleotide-binding universal stress UspA family protein
MYEDILVPMDGSPLAECVMPHAVALARAFNSQILLLNVLARSSRPDGRSAVDPLEWRLRRTEAESYLHDVSARLQEAGIAAEAHILEGDAAEQIVGFVRERHIGLTIMSSHGQSGLSGWNVSSVVQKVILRAYTSLLIVRAYQPAAEDVAGLSYGRVLLPLDGSQRAESVLPVAGALARAAGAHLLLAHVVQRPEMPRRVPLSNEETELAERLVERNQASASQYLADISTRLPPGCVETRMLISNHVAASLQELAEQEDVDLVLLSAHGYSGETRWPYGGVVASFVAYGSAPLLIVQDVGPDEVQPTRAEIAAQSAGRR